MFKRKNVKSTQNMKKKVAMFCDFKFEDLEVMYPKIRLEEEGVQVDVIDSSKRA